uniref:DUF1618 domain-containing protein n=1 Tax=Aegilops tauschii TaxID=37682 RepID=R7WDY6_AEGTA
MRPQRDPREQAWRSWAHKIPEVEHQQGRARRQSYPTSSCQPPSRRTMGAPVHRSGGAIKYVPLTARRGLLLVRLTAEDPLAYDYEYELRVCLAMCNPLAGVCDVLPPLSNTFEFSKSGYAILTSADCSSSTQPLPGYSIFFKVIIMGVIEHGRPPHLYTFSSGEARWSTPTVLSFDADPEIRDYRPLRHPDGVVSRGKVHWIVGDWSMNCSKLYTLDVDAETYRVSRTKIAVPTTNANVCSRSYDEPQLSVAANGTLSVLFLPWSKLRLEICTRQDNGKTEDGATAGGWLDTRLVRLKPPEPERSETSSMYFSLLGEKSGAVLLKGLHRHMYIGDLETGAMERMTGWVRGLNRH